MTGLSTQFLQYFFEEKDADYFGSLGLNCIRIAFVSLLLLANVPSAHPFPRIELSPLRR